MTRFFGIAKIVLQPLCCFEVIEPLLHVLLPVCARGDNQHQRRGQDEIVFQCHKHPYRFPAASSARNSVNKPRRTIKCVSLLLITALTSPSTLKYFVLPHSESTSPQSNISSIQLFISSKPTL